MDRADAIYNTENFSFSVDKHIEMLPYMHSVLFKVYSVMIFRKGGKRMDNYDVILEFFSKSEKPVRASEVATATGVDKKEVDKVMTKLKKEGKIVSPKACYWEIKR